MAYLTYITQDGETVRVEATDITIDNAGPDDRVLMTNGYAVVLGCLLTAHNNYVTGSGNRLSSVAP